MGVEFTLLHDPGVSRGSELGGSGGAEGVPCRLDCWLPGVAGGSGGAGLSVGSGGALSLAEEEDEDV